MSFIHDDFLLATKAARRLYHTFARDEPILDYHNHLPAKDIAQDRQFKNLFEIWLEGDHYKWRAMRCNGVPEKFITGDASPFEKFKAWAATVPHTLRNPLYHWTHLELQRYFGISELLSEHTAITIWEKTCQQLDRPEMSARNILRKQRVKALCTTDDPTDDLAHHLQCAADGFEVGVHPTFRPDKALAVHQPAAWNPWCDKLSAASGIEVKSYDSLLAALQQRHDFFHSVGGRLSDHGLNYCHASFISDAEAERIFQKARSGKAADATEHDQFASNIMLHVGRLNAAKAGPCSSTSAPSATTTAASPARSAQTSAVTASATGRRPSPSPAFSTASTPRTPCPRPSLYNVNPNANYVFGTMAGNFADGTTPGKVQFGSAWWFVDQKEGMEWQINALSNLGLLSRFIGMLTDSRSFMSFPRHEYFRRTLCNLLGTDIEAGLIPDDDALVGTMVKNICYANAKSYLGLKTAT